MDKEFRMMRYDRIDTFMFVLKYTAHMGLLFLCFFNIFRNDTPVLEDVWTVLLTICLFRIMEISK